jgi:hypothetical protein
VGYLPTEAGFDQGAYESWRSEWSWTNRGTGERLTERAATLLDQVAASKMPLLVAQQKGAVPS